MDLEHSGLFVEAKRIVAEGTKPVHYYWNATFHYGDNETLKAFKVVSIDVIKNLETNFTDEIILELLVEQGKFIKRIYPKRNNLEMTLKCKPLYEVADESNKNKPLTTEKFVAVILDQISPMIENNDGTVPDEKTLDMSNFATVHIQLINKSVDLIRMKSIGSTFRNTTTGDLIKSILTTESANIDVDKEILPLGVDMVKPDNTKVRDHILIPQGTKIVDIPQYVQNKCGGVYSTGLSYYFHDRYWYIFPTYNTERFDTSEEQLTILAIPGNKFDGVERSYRKSGSNLTIICPGSNVFIDKSDYQQLNLGNGARFSDADNFVEDYVSVKDNKATASRNKNVSEVITTKRESGNNNVQLADRSITSNPFREYSDLARRDGSIINLVWQYSNPELLKPNLPVKILYLENEEIREIYGTLLNIHHFTTTYGKVLFANRHVTNTTLSVYVNRKKIEN